jgi:hypothetical protein
MGFRDHFLDHRDHRKDRSIALSATVFFGTLILWALFSFIRVAATNHRVALSFHQSSAQAAVPMITAKMVPLAIERAEHHIATIWIDHHPHRYKPINLVHLSNAQRLLAGFVIVQAASGKQQQ